MDNRELKFRAWDDDRGEMMYDLSQCTTIFWNNDEALFVVAKDKANGDWNELQVMQFTGMKAKDGTGIYEGDIVVADRYPFFNDGVPGYVGVIEWAHGAWYYGLECVNDKLAGSAIGDQLGADGKEVTEFRVIGNIYEHPHLLSGGN